MCDLERFSKIQSHIVSRFILFYNIQASLGVNITSKTSTAHVVEFTNSNGISNEVNS